jgi:hypothetical protein
MGYASKGERVVGEFESTIGTPYCFGSVEVGSFVFNVVYLERIECKEFEDCETAMLELLFQCLYYSSVQ